MSLWVSAKRSTSLANLQQSVAEKKKRLRPLRATKWCRIWCHLVSRCSKVSFTAVATSNSTTPAVCTLPLWQAACSKLACYKCLRDNSRNAPEQPKLSACFLMYFCHKTGRSCMIAAGAGPKTTCLYDSPRHWSHRARATL